MNNMCEKQTEIEVVNMKIVTPAFINNFVFLNLDLCGESFDLVYKTSQNDSFMIPVLRFNSLTL